MNRQTITTFYTWPESYDQHTMLIDDSGHSITYAEGRQCGELLFSSLKKRSLILILCQNTFGSVLSYIHALRHEIVPMLLSDTIDINFYQNILNTYAPEYIAIPSQYAHEYTLNMQFLGHLYDYDIYQNTLGYPTPMNDLLALLLSTSGSTGSPKFVRQSYQNINANAASIVQYLNITEMDRPITTLPMNYTYGLSIINSHLMTGATILLTTHSIVQAEFWKFFINENATTFGGVPYTYEMLKKLRFSNMNLPSLQTMTQAGGHLPSELQAYFTAYAEKTDKQLVIMYGQTEATARMSYLPYHMSDSKFGSIGIPIPDGHFELIDENGTVIDTPDTPGELIYYGPNVTLGYASCRSHLASLDNNHGRLETGDIAKRDSDGYYYIVGRKKRFIKLYGHRISLDEIEQLLASQFPDMAFACTGDDHQLNVYTTTMASNNDRILDYLSQSCNIYYRAIQIQNITEIPKNTAGKIQYRSLT